MACSCPFPCREAFNPARIPIMEVKSFSTASSFNLIAFQGSANPLHYRTRSSIFPRRATEWPLRNHNNHFKVRGSSQPLLFWKHAQISSKFHHATKTTNNNNNSNKYVFKSIFEALLKSFDSNNGNNSPVLVLEVFRRLLAFVVVLLAIGFIPHRSFQRRALAAAPATATVSAENIIHRDEKISHSKIAVEENKVLEYKEEMAEAVSFLEQRLRELRARDMEKADEEIQSQIRRVKEALDIIRFKSKNLRTKTLFHMEAILRGMRKEEEKLIKEVEQIADSYVAARLELDKMAQEVSEDEQKRKLKEKRENEAKDVEKRLRDVWSALTRLEAEIVAKETEGLRLAFQEIPALEKKSENKVEELFRPSAREYEGYANESTMSRIEKELEEADEKTWERLFLPIAVDTEDPQMPVDEIKRKLLECIMIESQKSREMQEQLDNLVRSGMKKSGEEKLVLVESPEKDVLQGLPPVELKWHFGDKEVYVPRAANFYIAQGWKKWREEAKANLKKKLLEDVQLGKKYVAERQAHLQMIVERVSARTRYNAYKEWEMDPVVASYAVTKGLVEWARIRQDWAVMFISLKGDDRIYQVDIQAFDSLFGQVGGFDGLFVKMITSAIPITVERSHPQFLKRFILFFNIIVMLPTWDWYWEKLREVLDEFMVLFGFPIIEFITTKLVGELIVGSTYYLNWAVTAEQRVEDLNTFRRVTLRLPGWFVFAIKGCFYGYPLLLGFKYLVKFLHKVKYISPGRVTLPESPHQARLRKVQMWSKQQPRSPEKKKGKRKGKKNDGDEEPTAGIQGAFDRMKRIKNPPIPLKDFFGIDAVKQEVNEVVTFLKNPKRFKEMGARPPRGVLITGRAGTGKTPLAFAIAAEAKVPLVEVKPDDLEDVRWIGQGPANVRELFQTARELAPVIIFMDNFDSFAGIRGELSDTEFGDMNHEHEALINQLLVELDGFETQEGVVFIATARNPDAIDEALCRPGRMDRRIHLSFKPDEREREMLLLSAAKSTMRGDLIDFVDWQKVAEKTTGLTAKQVMYVPLSLEMSAFATKMSDDEELFSIFSWLVTMGSIIPNWLKHTKWKKKLEEALVDRIGLQLTKEDIELTVENMEPYGRLSLGLERYSAPVTWSRESKFPHAVWAAGRGLVACLLPNFDSVDNIWLDSVSWEGVGCTKLTKCSGGVEDAQTISRSYLEKQLVLCFASYAASQLLGPVERNNLSRLEIEDAQELATRMVLEYGWGPDDSPMVYVTSKLQMKAIHTGKDNEFELENKIEKLFYTACEKATELLQKNRKTLDALVEHLLEYDFVVKQEILRIMEENGAVQEPEPFMLIKYRNYELSTDMSTNGTARVSGTLEASTFGV